MAVPSLRVALGSRLPWFTVESIDGEVKDTGTLSNDCPTLVAFLCNHSPYVRHIERRFAEVASEYASDVETIVICSNDERAYPIDNEEGIRRQIGRAQFQFPYYRDPGQRAAKSFGANCTPEFFIYGIGGRLLYHGQFDGSRPGNDIPVTGNDLRNALRGAIGNVPLLGDQAPSFGCSIKWAAGNEPVYLYTRAS